ncbi:DNA primase [Pseudoroseicyclus aestuarii]|uniref:DNA primase n=1 Tax=Pseudoroseicyclus aestuarii TaxID=1795041 RepID=A0A318T662_9RHOB|nr:DNA primase [Pseudoroseicyclus aestuarii]PYE85914.1 DNA primase [Pseudoroseicyclus aestuarii]
MKLPPGFLDELRDRVSLGRVAGRKVTWDPRKSNQGKGDLWAPCPFHQEKTASFHVDDRKGFYYCFGCHAKGDVLNFVQETENLGFMEAVESLAREAGMPMPARDPAAKAKMDRRGQLTEVMEQAARFYRMRLQGGGGAAARDYLAGRGLSEAGQERFGLGLAPDGWRALTDHLTQAGVPMEMLKAAGLSKESAKGGKPYDVFRNRLMFPIRDARGRCIAFGGRAMDPGESAKYLNSPQTELFDKGRSLYNVGPARAALGREVPLILAEGYMDVIALSEAGFEAAVAPLGTAVTADQLQLIWRLCPEPVVALDGDTAGVRAAGRLVDLALPLIEPGQGLRFAVLPGGQDPDDLIKAQGAEGMRAVLEGAQPMLRMLWRRATEGRVIDSAERRAGLEHELKQAIGAIRDPGLRRHAESEIRQLMWDSFGGGRRKGPARPRGQGGKPAWGRDLPVQASAEALAAAAGDADEEALREAVVLAAVLSTPAVLPEVEAALERMECRTPAHRAIRDAVLHHAGRDDLRQSVRQELGGEVLDSFLGQHHLAIMPAVRRAGDLDIARQCILEELAKLAVQRGVPREIEEAAAALGAAGHPLDEALTWRLGQAAAARDRAWRGNAEDRTEYESASNGALLRRDEREELSALLGGIDYSKSSGRR